MASMATYLLTGVDDEQWKHFKAACDLEGITLKQSFLEHIDITIEMLRVFPGLYKPGDRKQKKGGKKK